MLTFLSDPVRGVIAALLLALNTLPWCAALFPLRLLKLAALWHEKDQQIALLMQR